MSLRSPRRPIRRGLPHLVDFGWRERLTRTHIAMFVALGKGKLRHQRFLPEELSWRNFPVFEARTLRTQRAHREQRRRPCYQTFLKKPLSGIFPCPPEANRSWKPAGACRVRGVSTRCAPVARAHAPVPKSASTPAVSPMASAPEGDAQGAHRHPRPPPAPPHPTQERQGGAPELHADASTPPGADAH